MRPDQLETVPEAEWPKELTTLQSRRARGGRRVITNRQLAALLGCTVDNVKKMARQGKIQREPDLDGPNVRYYRVEEAARAYFARRPDRIPEPDYEADIPFLARRREERERQEQERLEHPDAGTGLIVHGQEIKHGQETRDLVESWRARPMPTSLDGLTPEMLAAATIQLAQTQRRMGELLQQLVDQRNLGMDREEQIAELNDKITDLNDDIRRRDEEANRTLREAQDRWAARTERLMELTEENAGLKIDLARSSDRTEQLAAQVTALTAQLQAGTPPVDELAPTPRLPRRRKTPR